jgi:hypothetical protein
MQERFSQRQSLLSNTRTNNGTTGLCNSLLGNGSVSTLPRRRDDVTLQKVLSYHVTCFLCDVRYGAAELCFLCCPCGSYVMSPPAAEKTYPRGGGVDIPPP